MIGLLKGGRSGYCIRAQGGACVQEALNCADRLACDIRHFRDGKFFAVEHHNDFPVSGRKAFDGSGMCEKSSGGKRLEVLWAFCR